jgi:PhnB protein
MNNQTVTFCINIQGAGKAIEFYKSVFGAMIQFEDVREDGFVNHAKLLFGSTVLMLCDEVVDIGALSPKTVGGCPLSINIEVDGADKVYDLAIQNGATSIRPMSDQSWGARSGMVLDPFGFRWGIREKTK